MSEELFFSTGVEDFGSSKSNTSNLDLGDKLIESIKKVLISRFPDSKAKQEIENTSKGYSIACPYCGDSRDHEHKKRGKIYLNTNSFKCWNGGCFTYRPLNVFLSDFDANDFSFTERERFMVEHAITNSANKKSLADFYNDDIMFDKNEIIRALKAKSITSSIKGLKYLESRNADKIGLHDLAYNDYFNNLIFLNMFNDKVLGVQVRLSTPMKNGGRFISYNYDDINVKLLKKDNYNKDMSNPLNKVSLIYNILNINFQLPVNIFESTIDCKYFNNSIALWGSNNILEIKTGYYYFDNDEAGRKSAMHYLNSGHNVFLWRLFLKDHPKFSSVKDFNDIYKIDRYFDNRITKKYFGNTKFDKMNL